MKNTQKGFIGIAAIVLIALAGAGYYISIHKQLKTDILNTVWSVRTDKSKKNTNNSTSTKEMYQKYTEQRNSTLTIHFKSNTDESQAVALKDLLQKQSGVVSVEYTSAGDELAAFKERHKDDQLTLDALETAGKDSIGAQIVVKLKSSSDRANILNLIKESAQYSSVDQVM